MNFELPRFLSYSFVRVVSFLKKSCFKCNETSLSYFDVLKLN